MEPSEPIRYGVMSHRSNNEDRQLLEKHRNLENVPERYRNLDWKADIRNLRNNTIRPQKNMTQQSTKFLSMQQLSMKKKKRASQKKKENNSK